MELFNSLSSIELTLSMVFLGFLSYMLGGVIGLYSLGYSDKELDDWLNKNQNDLTEFFYREQKQAIAKRLLDKTIDTHARMRAYRLISVSLFALLFFTSPNTVVFCVLSVIFFTLLWLSAVDIDSHTVSEKPLYIMTFVVLGFFVLVPEWRWMSGDNLLLGTFLVLAAITVSIQISKLLMRLSRKAETVAFGDGDILILIALTLFFGVDVLIGLGISSILFVIANLVKPLYLSFLIKMGHHPVSLEDADVEGMAFVPFIFMGMLITTVLSLTNTMTLSTSIQALYQLILFP